MPAAIRLACAAGIAAGFAFEYPVFVSYLMSRSLTSVQISALLALQSIGVFLFEYITGVLADRFGYKKLLMLSSAAMVAAEAIFIFAGAFIPFAVAIILISAAVAAKSGADIAFLHDALERDGLESEFDRIFSGVSAVSLVGEAVIVLAGSWLCLISMKLPFALTALSSLFSLTVYLFLRTTPKKKVNTRQIIAGSFRLFRTSGLFVILTAAAVLMFPMYHLLSYYTQPYLSAVKVPIQYFGLFYVQLILLQSAGTKMTPYLLKKLNGTALLAVSSILIAACFMLLLLRSLYVTVPVFILLGVFFGWFYTGNTIMLNKLATSENRATLMSQQHFFAKISQTVLLLAAGAALDFITVDALFFYLGTVILAALVVFGLIALVSKRKCTGL